MTNNDCQIEILCQKPGTQGHTIRARFSEAVSNGFLNRLGEGFYDFNTNTLSPLKSAFTEFNLDSFSAIECNFLLVYNHGGTAIIFRFGLCNFFQ